MTIKVQSEQQPIMNAYATSKTLYRDPYSKDTIAAVGYSTANQQVVSHTVEIQYGEPVEVQNEEIVVTEETVATPYRNPATKVVYRDPYKKDIIAAVEYSSLEVQNEEAIPAEETAEDSLPQKTVTHKIEINYDEIPYRNPYSKGTEQAQQKTVMNMKITGYAQQYCENLGDMSPPDTSNCWQWNVPEVNFGEQKGCDYDKCAAAVCECDPFCCSDSWDLSCRGYKESPTDLFKDNPFNPGCSASILCCEQEEAVPDPPVVANCATAGWVPPDDSTCWQWKKQGSSPQVQIGDQKGCDFQLCENAVCACDSYCCDVSWDLSCRGFEIEDGDLKDNYFVSGCSSHLLCCEPESAFPDPPLPPNNPPNRPPEIIEPPQAILPPKCVTDGWATSGSSNCFEWVEAGSGSQKGCDSTLCEVAVCSCDPYCCQTSWDHSCAGQASTPGAPLDNPFTPGCSAHLLCCNDSTAQAVLPPTTGGTGSSSTTVTVDTGTVVTGTVGTVETVTIAIPISKETQISTVGSGSTNIRVNANIIDEKMRTTTIEQIPQAVLPQQTGKSGKSGKKGKSGKSGSKGKSGAKGKSGSKGKSGKSGAEGSKGKSGGDKVRV